jgi:hypothetical protein
MRPSYKNVEVTMGYKEKVLSESEILYAALVSCSEDWDKHNQGAGLMAMLGTEPVTQICDRLNRKLNEQGYRVTKLYEKRKTGEK